MHNGSDIAEERRWQAVYGRLTEKRNDFVYGVTTTGVFCRPGCPSRLPLRRNVLFFDAPSDAEAMGFRACKRCHGRAGSQAS